MNKARVVMEVLRTMAAIVAATALLMHSGQTESQSRLDGPWSFTREQVFNFSVAQSLAWNGACVLSNTDCAAIPPPRVGYALLDQRFGIHEIGTRTVLIDLRLLGQVVAIPVMVHEMTHYLQSRRSPKRAIPISAHEACMDEKEAHELTTEFVKRTGISEDDERVRPWEKAAFGYRCTVDGRSLTLRER